MPRRRTGKIPGTGAARWAALFAGLLLPLPAARAQTPQAIGTMQGRDVTVEHPASSAAERSSGTPVGNASVVVVHSGRAHLELNDAGISICGPAKFTILQNGNALTLALEFGTLHVTQKISGAPIEVYTPFFTALPEAREGTMREFTAGLDSNGLFCARAIQGAVSLEQQLTGGRVIVPEPSESYFRGGDTVPLRDPPGHCVCEANLDEIMPAPDSQNRGTTAVPANSADTRSTASGATMVARAAATPSSELASEAASEVAPGVAPGVAPEVARKAAPAPAASGATATPSNSGEPPTISTPAADAGSLMPALTFDYAAPAPWPTDIPDDAALLHNARINSGWVLQGHVGKNAAANEGEKGGNGWPGKVNQSSKPGEANSRKSSPKQTSPASQPSGAKPQHESFWSKLKHLFGGGS